uniref:Band 7 domain-containing protein n=1 Tax=Gopherus agassizii TaxID=38772 RepID=A0A452HCD6_9SAUR
MFSRSGYQALPLGDYNRFPQSSTGVYGSQKSLFSFGHAGGVQSGDCSSQDCLSWICHGIVTSLAFLLMVITFPISRWFVLKIVPAYERMTGPGMVLLLPFIDHWQLVDLRTRAFYNPGPLSVISMGADIQFRVWDAVLSVMMVKDLNAAIRMMAQNAMTKTLLKKNLREIQTEKLRIGDHLLVRVCL